ncbi:putative DNA-binding protein [Streptococcus rupicaprae]|uniref:DNA-binding protein n=1 Tax=Streptococcus rupicaprae TaxID=759619 RepID=A0ABV2FJL4_9STRE
MTTPVSVRFDETLSDLLTRVTQDRHTTKADFIRQAVTEKLEDIYAIELADEAYATWLADGKSTHSHEDFMTRYG